MFFKKKNFLDSYLDENYNSNKKLTKKYFWLLGLVFFLGFLVISVPLVFNGLIIVNRVLAVNGRVELMVSAVNQLDLLEVDQQSLIIIEDLTEIKVRLKKIGPIRYLPPVKRLTIVGDKFLSSSINILDGYNDILSIFISLDLNDQEDSLLLGLSQSDNKKEILKLIDDNKSKLISAENKIKLAKTDLDSIEKKDLIGLFGNQINKVNSLLYEVADRSDMILPVIKFLPELAGLNETKSYLVLFKNNMELRPTGGFIGSYGLLKIRDGKIISFETDDIYNLDKHSIGKLDIAPPWPMTTYFNQKNLFLRDANWSPDWPTSAKEIEWFWNVERENAGLAPVELSGIIAITPDFIADVLELTGDIELDGIVFNHKNFALELEIAVEFDYVDKGIPKEQRKDIISDLSKILISRVFDLSAWKMLDFLSIMKRSVSEKHIIAWTKNYEINNYLINKNWAGSIRETDGDYLYVVDANLGALKTDQVMKRSIDYKLNINDNNELIGRAEINYEHKGERVTALINRYRTYTRIYLPDKTWIIRAYLEDENGISEIPIPEGLTIGDEFNKRFVGLFFTVDIKSSKKLVLEYRLPENIKQNYLAGMYKLIVQKQPGTVGHFLSLDLDFKNKIESYDSPVNFIKSDTKRLLFNYDLRTDYELEVNFK